MISRIGFFFLTIVFLLGSVSEAAPETEQADDNQETGEQNFTALDDEVQQLKQQVLDLNRDLFLLEEELLYPSSTQVAVFVSVDTGTFFGLDSVEIKIDSKVVANYLYTKREVEGLHRGGIHRIFTGNLKSGQHELVALVVGKGPQGRDYRRGSSIVFEKALGPKYLQLKIRDSDLIHQPEFEFKEW